MDRAFKVNLAKHGENCSDLSCPLPICVNWRLQKIRLGNHPQKDKQRGLPRAGSKRNRHEHLQTREFFDKQHHAPLCITDDNEEERLMEQLLVDLEEIQNDVQGATGGDPMAPLEAIPNWPSLPLGAPCHPPTNQAHQPVFAFFPSQPSNPADSGCLLPDLEQFIPLDPYVTNKPNPSPFTVPAFAVRESTDQSRVKMSIPGEQPLQAPNKSCKLFGILSEIFRMFEEPATAHLQTIYEQVLQRALREIKSACIDQSRRLSGCSSTSLRLPKRERFVSKMQ